MKGSFKHINTYIEYGLKKKFSHILKCLNTLIHINTPLPGGFILKCFKKKKKKKNMA